MDKKSRQIVTLSLSEEDADALFEKANSQGLLVGELLESFIADLIWSDKSNGSDERMYADMWFDQCRCNFPGGKSSEAFIHVTEDNGAS